MVYNSILIILVSGGNIVIQHIIPYNVINPSLPILVNICHFISMGYIGRIIYSWLAIFISQHSYVFVFLLLNSRYLLHSLLFAFSRCDVMLCSMVLLLSDVKVDLFHFFCSLEAQFLSFYVASGSYILWLLFSRCGTIVHVCGLFLTKWLWPVF